MTLKTRLTLGFVLLATLITGAISAADLANVMHLEFDATLDRAQLMTGGVAHEVKNPLNAILLHVEVARAKMSRGDTDIAPQMEIISREIVRLDRVVKTFLDFTRPVDLKFSNVPLRELMEEIAQLYFTTKKEGSGIGLAMTFRIVQLQDGTIDFTSEPGKGTTFVIRLPIAA